MDRRRSSEARGSGSATPAPDATFLTAYRDLVGLAVLMTGSRAVAEDVVQDVFLRTRGRLDGLDHPERYLRVAVGNACRSWHRRVGSERRAVDRLDGGGRTSAPPDDVLDLESALRRLPEEQRAVLVLRYFADLNDTEIADVLGCRRATVRTRAHRAFQRLRKELGDGA